MLERLQTWTSEETVLWLFFGAVALWMLLRWGRLRWRQHQAARRRRAFDAREARRWAGHRREGGGDIKRLGRK